MADLLKRRAREAGPVLVALDDVQWLDEASVALLHFVLRMAQDAPLLVALTARGGELADNPATMQLLRSLRRERLLSEIALAPLDADETARLIAAVAPAIDAGRVFAESGGNPLFALEVARSLPYRRRDPPKTVGDLVRDRVERLPDPAADLLRWAAVLGQTFEAERLQEMASVGLDALMEGLETLERHALLRPTRGGDRPGFYTFGHDIVRRAVYAELSEPRRRLMHGRVARILFERHGTDEVLAAEIARHAALAGEAELAARACVAAGHRCLRLLAGAEAYYLARRGLRYADRIEEPERCKLMLELTKITFTARRPRLPEEAAVIIERLAETALDHGCIEHARLGFHLLGYLRWERGEWRDAQRQMMRAEWVSRGAGDWERVKGMAEAARCLALLERDLGQAEALLLEAGALAQRIGRETSAAADAAGMLRLHEGRLEEAEARFREARALARRDGDRLAEFWALEHLVMVALQRGRPEEATALAEALVAIGEKLREGSEAPLAHCLRALARYAGGESAAAADLDRALEALRSSDAKHRLAYVLMRAAEVDLDSDPARAAARGREALATARALEGRSDIVLALSLLERAARAAGDRAERAKNLAELRAMPLDGVSAAARAAAELAFGSRQPHPVAAQPRLRAGRRPRKAVAGPRQPVA